MNPSNNKWELFDPRRLVFTEDELAPPPDVTVPEPMKDRGRLVHERKSPSLGEIQTLAERLGGLERLRDLVDVMIRTRKPNYLERD